MITPIESKQQTSGARTKMLEQMADALEEEVAGLFRRAATFEEEEFLLNREVGERQTEINRLLLKLEAIRAERDRVMEKIESISREAEAIREEVFRNVFVDVGGESAPTSTVEQYLFHPAAPPEEFRRF